jgi:hypothetical protein
MRDNSHVHHRRWRFTQQPTGFQFSKFPVFRKQTSLILKYRAIIIIRTISTSGKLFLRWNRSVTCKIHQILFECNTGGIRNAYLVGKPERNRPLARKIRRWEDNIRMDLQQIKWETVTGFMWLRICTSCRIL